MDNFDRDYDIVNKMNRKEGITMDCQLKIVDLFFTKWKKHWEDDGGQ